MSGATAIDMQALPMARMLLGCSENGHYLLQRKDINLLQRKDTWILAR